MYVALKFGLSPEVTEKFHLQQVTLEGTYIGGELDAMIEVVPETIVSSGVATGEVLAESAGLPATLRGEIVDAKCHLGVMNPGCFKPHRAWAIRCLAGGVPPLLVVRTTDGQLAHYLLVGEDGAPINEAVFDFVAEPVEVSGSLKTIGERKVIYVDPGKITRLLGGCRTYPLRQESF
ncbi:MAG: hypothetical protein ACI9UA_003747 [Pseudoalteromonas tetraodonis]